VIDPSIIGIGVVVKVGDAVGVVIRGEVVEFFEGHPNNTKVDESAIKKTKINFPTFSALNIIRRC
jgi:hypothetical protein